MTDSITVLSHSHGRLAKRWLADGTIEPYQDTKQYTVTSVPVADIQALSTLLTKLEGKSHAGVIRGTFKGEEVAKTDPDFKAGLSRKILANFADVPHHWVLIEVDKFEPVVDPQADPEAAIREYITARLPDAFHDASYHWQLSNSAGHEKNAGKLKVHLWFWLAQPANSADLKRWATDYKIDTDKSVLNPVQFHYTAAPVAAPGVVIPVPRRSGFVQSLFDDTVHLDFTRTLALAAPDAAPWDDTADLDLLEIEQARLGWTLPQGRAILADLDPNCDRETWVKTLAAFHFEFHGSEEALDVADEWSATGEKYGGREEVEGRWYSFGKHRGGNIAGGKWLMVQQRERVVHVKYEALEQRKTEIQNAPDEFTLREKICPDIQTDFRLGDLERESLAQALVTAFGKLGTKYGVPVCRKLVVEKRLEKVASERDIPEWLQGWVYVTEDDRFCRQDGAEVLTIQGFNACFNREMPPGDGGAKTAAWQVLDSGMVPLVTRSMYVPFAGPLFTSQDGVSCINTYRPSSVPTAVESLSAAGRHAVSVVMRHLRLICGGREEVVQTFVDWMAHNVQKPGCKIRWAPLIKGVEGDGKSLLGELMAAVMGRANVRNVSPKVLGTDFTGWAEGSALIVLEEIKLTGHNRYDILNALKPFLTNPNVEVHRKGRDGYDTVNTTNYAAFTNYADALPLTDTDRRWWIIFTPFASLNELAAALGAGVARDVLSDYFNTLTGVIQQQPAELRRWLLDHTISASFKPDSAAPMTEEKAVMIGMSVSEEESTVREILEKGGVGIAPDIFASSYLSSEVVMSGSDISLATSGLSRLFSKVGFTRMPKKIKWRGKTEIVWVKGHKHWEPASLRARLNKTLPKGEICDENTGEGSLNDDLF